MLQKQNLRRPRLEGELRLRFLAFLAAEGWVGQHDVEEVRRALIEAAIDFLAGERIAVPDVWPVDAVDDEIGERDRIDQVLLFAAVEGARFQPLDGFRCDLGAEMAADVLHRLSEEAAGATTGIIDRLAGFGIDRSDDGADDLARGKELAAIIALLAHAQQQSLVGLREDKHMLLVSAGRIDLVNPVEHVEKIALGIDARVLKAGQGFANDFLARRGIGILGELFEVRNKVAVNKAKEVAKFAGLQFLAL